MDIHKFEVCLNISTCVKFLPFKELLGLTETCVYVTNVGNRKENEKKEINATFQ